MATLEQKQKNKQLQEQKERQVCADYLSLSSTHPEAAPYSIFETLAQKYREVNAKTGGNIFPSTTMGVRNIIIRNGYYTPQKR